MLEYPLYSKQYAKTVMTQPKTTTRVIVGMSGGVDSSVTAYLLKQQGYYVEGLFMKNWEEEPGMDDNCSADQDLIDAQSVCLKLGIRLHTANFATEYWDNVFTYFLEEYEAGRTPNPDILCNREIKFNAFLDKALQLGADYIATGHYARRNPDNTDTPLLKGLDNNKDQSYFLYAVPKEHFRYALFPLGELTKDKVREIADTAGFKNANKKDSTGICFIGERHFRQFLQQYLPAQPGNIETTEGDILGQHQGLMYYTLGQRQGLGIGGQKGASDAPWYVVDKDLQRNVLIVGQGHNHPRLFARGLIAYQLNWLSNPPQQLPFKCQAKIRYRQPQQPCQIIHYNNQGQLTVAFDEPQRAITPGQSAVFYQHERCLGGGIIETAVDSIDV